MTRRLFTFGCSFTYYFYYPTWADFVGLNFDEFYNLGWPGMSNRTMAERFIEVDSKFKFNQNDYVIIATSGITRYNFLIDVGNDQTSFFCHGDLKRNANEETVRLVEKLKPYYDIIRFYRDRAWNPKWGVYHTWSALKTMKRILESNNVPHKIFPGLDTSFYFENELLDLNEDEKYMSKEIYDMFDIKKSLQQFNDEYPNKHPFGDPHPFIDCHKDYVKTYLPEFYNEKTISYYNQLEELVSKYQDSKELYDYLGSFKRHRQIKIYGDYI